MIEHGKRVDSLLLMDNDELIDAVQEAESEVERLRALCGKARRQMLGNCQQYRVDNCNGCGDESCIELQGEIEKVEDKRGEG
jgi:hypothetical protein